jgi:hypothetical protein
MHVAVTMPHHAWYSICTMHCEASPQCCQQWATTHTAQLISPGQSPTDCDTHTYSTCFYIQLTHECHGAWGLPAGKTELKPGLFAAVRKQKPPCHQLQWIG